MQRGRELDKRIALEVMGWEKSKILKPTKFGADYAMPHYSTDINEAMKVAEKIELFQTHVLHCSTNKDGTDLKWNVSKLENGLKIKEFVSGETPEIAICLASLLLTGSDIN